MSAANGNAQRQPGVDTAHTSDINKEFTPILDGIKATLLAGQSIRVIDYPPEDRQQVVGAIAAMQDVLPIRLSRVDRPFGKAIYRKLDFWLYATRYPVNCRGGTAIMRFDTLIWTWAYSLEDRRQAHASARHLWSQAACCIALALVRKLERMI